MTGVNLGAARGRSLRLAAIGALMFSVLFAVHHVLQAPGPVDSSPAEVAAYNVAHQAAQLSSEVALGFGLLAFIVFLAPLAAVIWREGTPPWR